MVAQAQAIAVFAARTTPPIDANASAPIAAQYIRVSAKRLPQTGQQSIQDIEADARRRPSASLEATLVRFQVALQK